MQLLYTPVLLGILYSLAVLFDSTGWILKSFGVCGVEYGEGGGAFGAVDDSGVYSNESSL